MIDVDSAALRLGVVGAGAMGSGIAQVALAGGIGVVLLDADRGVLPRAREQILGRLARLAEKGSLGADVVAAAGQRLQTARGVADFAACGVVVEAVVEDLAVKQRLFAELEEVVAPDAILASNTSSLSIAAIAKALKRRDRVAGMHFFNPVPVMRLVEIVRAAETADWVVAALTRLGQRLGRTPVKVKDAPGFLVNLGGRAYVTEALHALEEGVASAAAIDTVMRECCGFRMGPFELMDLTGIDVNFPVSRIIHQGYFGDPRLKTTPSHESLYLAGRLGRKTGAGFHAYDAQGQRLADTEPAEPDGDPPARIVLAEADPTLVALAAAAGVETVAHDDGASPIMVAPLGEDATTAATRLGLAATRVVAVDLFADTSRRVTLMTPPAADPAAADAVAAVLRRAGRAVTRIKDSPGFIAQRITAMIANLGCEMAQVGLASPADIDLAMQLGLNYPQGPLALGDALGLARVHDVLTRLQAITGSDRYRPSLWLRRRALLGLSALTP